MISKEEIKERIETLEWNSNAMKYVNGGDVEAIIIEIDKEEKIVYADVILHYQMDGKQVKYSGLEYPFDVLKIEEGSE